MQKEPQSNDQSSSATLPALLPPVTLLIQRTQTTLGLLRDVVQESSAESWFKRGKAAEVSAQWTEAAYAYRQCVERDTGHWRGTVGLAAAVGYLGQPEAAARALVEASEVAVEGWGALVAELAEPTWHQLRDGLEVARGTARDSFGLLLGLALVYRALKQGEQARRTLDVMRFMYEQRVAGSAQWFRLSGNLYSNADLKTEAITEWGFAIDLKPDYVFAYRNRGDAKADLKDYAGAIADYDRAIELKPDSAFAFNSRGISKKKIQDYAGAIADYGCAIELKPDYAFAFYNRGIAREELQDYAGAIADYDRAIELKPDYASAYYCRGRVKADLKDYAGAIADYDRAIELKPDYAFAFDARGYAKINLQDYAGAIADYDRAIELAPENSDYYLTRGYAKENLHDYAGAIIDYNLVIQLEPNNADYYRFRADTKEKLGDTNGAAADREKSAQLTVVNASN